MIREGVLLFIKGMAMGAANVIPGVSGGTIAFITGIYEKFIGSLKSFDGQALRFILKLDIKGFSTHVNLGFLLILAFGILTSLLTIGKLLDYLFNTYPIYVWSFFFGLISISIVSVGRVINSWSFSSIICFIIGAAIATSLALITPASENSSIWYLVLCGIVAMASMILPGLSGSFVLILMGNYQLIMLKAVPGLDIEILVPVVIGAVLGFVILSRIISHFLSKHHDPTIAILTGFILGSLLVIWPWKSEVYMTDQLGNLTLKNGEGIVTGYNWFLPDATFETVVAALLIIAGIVLVRMIESLGKIQK